MLSGDPNALVTQDNIGDFSSLLEEILGRTGRIQEGVVSPGAFSYGGPPPPPLGSQHEQIPPFSGWNPSQQLAITLNTLRDPAGTNGSDVDMTGHTPMASAMIESMTSSPSVASMLNNSRHISPNHTPDTLSSLQFQGGGDSIFPANGQFSMSDINSILASAREPTGPAVQGQNAMSSMPMAPILPMFSMDGDFAISGGGNNGMMLSAPLDQQPSFAASLAEARMSTEGSRSNDTLKQQWLAQQKPVNASAPRSSRFSRFHPYLKTIARIAHRDSPTLLNRTPSTADPAVAAAAVNAMAAKFSRQEADAAAAAAAAAEQQSQLPQQKGLMYGPVPVAPRPSGVMPPGAHLAANLSVSQVVQHANNAGHTPSGRNARSARATEGGEGESRRYTCTFAGCVKQFKRYEHLKRHFRTHTGERPYKCPAPDCDKGFARMDNLNQHIRTHVNRKTANRRASGSGKAVKIPVGAGLAEDNVHSGLMFADSALFSVSGAPSSGFGENGIVLDTSSFSEPQPSLYAPLQSPRANARGMRIAMPEELSLMGREWFINNSSPPQPTAAPLPQPLQSPLMENNAVTMLRKISKNN
ncbi:hypothetical protein GGI24_005363, partial [Coemansia furcata]